MIVHPTHCQRTRLATQPAARAATPSTSRRWPPDGGVSRQSIDQGSSDGSARIRGVCGTVDAGGVQRSSPRVRTGECGPGRTNTHPRCAGRGLVASLMTKDESRALADWVAIPVTPATWPANYRSTRTTPSIWTASRIAVAVHGNAQMAHSVLRGEELPTDLVFQFVGVDCDSGTTARVAFDPARLVFLFAG
jgi:hypothetical protein